MEYRWASFKIHGQIAAFVSNCVLQTAVLLSPAVYC